MLLTLISNGNPVYIRPDIILMFLEIDEKNEKTGAAEHFTRIFTKDLNMGESIPNWIDVEESVKTICSGLHKKSRFA